MLLSMIPRQTCPITLQNLMCYTPSSTFWLRDLNSYTDNTSRCQHGALMRLSKHLILKWDLLLFNKQPHSICFIEWVFFCSCSSDWTTNKYHCHHLQCHIYPCVLDTPTWGYTLWCDQRVLAECNWNGNRNTKSSSCGCYQDRSCPLFSSSILYLSHHHSSCYHSRRR